MVNKALIYALAFFVSLSVLFGYLSYRFYSDKAVAQSTISQLERANKELLESSGKQDTACKIADQIPSEFIEQANKLEKEKDNLLEQIDKLSSTPKQKAEDIEGKSNDKVTISLDEPLPSELVRMLDEVHNSVQGQSTRNAK